MLAVIDYGVGNLFSLQSSLKAIGEDVKITSDREEIRGADRLILPGVGAFEDAARQLRESGMADLVREQARLGKPLMGICLGMQLLLDKSYEYGEHEGLGLIPGLIVPVRDVVPEDHKVPHIGWNALKFVSKGEQLGEKNRLFKYINEGDHVYFVHSYYAADCDDNCIALTEYGHMLTAAVARDNVFGCQFHPEKSGEVGLAILKAFCEMEG